MSDDQIIAQHYNESIHQIVESSGDSAARREAAEQAAHALDRKYGTSRISAYEYYLAKIYQIDERQGKTADRVIAAALGNTDVALFDIDLDVIVTLGGGKRKPWEFITVKDLEDMDKLRYANVKSAQRAYYKEWHPAYVRLREAMVGHSTFGDAYRAGGFPPSDLTTEAVA